MFKTMDDFDFSGKRVLVRTDINAPVINGKIQNCLRIEKSCGTIKELSDKASVAILAHQGRKGNKDYTESMEQHANILSKAIRKKVYYLNDLLGKTAIEKIKKLKQGVLLLKNVRSLDEETEEKSPEEHAKGKLVKTLAPLFDFFVNDAFSAAHRSHASLVGFIPVLPSCAGRLMENEYKNISRIKKPKHPNTLILGGAKPEDVFDIMENLSGVDKFLIGGILIEIFLAASGEKIELENEEFLGKAKELLKKYGRKILLPIDFAFEKNGKRVETDKPSEKILDIGSKTIKKYSEEISKSSTITMKGPMGVFEKKMFAKGTEEILKAISKSKGFTVLGGGHTSSLPEKFGIPLEKFSHVSIAGGAFIRMLSGKKLVVIEALEKYGDQNK